jgi:hypothetical protein
MPPLCSGLALEKQMDHDRSPHDADSNSFRRSRYAVGLLVMGAIAAYFLLSERRAHFLGALPYLLLLACPLIHVFMHGGHGGLGGGHGHHRGGRQGENTSSPSQTDKDGEPP